MTKKFYIIVIAIVAVWAAVVVAGILTVVR
jgi:hypothetical protein